MTKCTFCSFQSLDKVELVRHLFQAHSSDSNFSYVCGISSCTRSFTKDSSFEAFRSHCTRYHHNWREILIPATGVGDGIMDNEMDTSCVPFTDTEDNTVDHSSILEENLDSNDLENRPVISNSCSEELVDPEIDHANIVKVATANFLLTLKENFKLPQSSIDYTVKAVEEITIFSANSIKHSVMNHLHTAGFDHSHDHLFDACFSPTNPFVELKTEYQQTKFFKEEFGVVVSMYQ